MGKNNKQNKIKRQEAERAAAQEAAQANQPSFIERNWKKIAAGVVGVAGTVGVLVTRHKNNEDEVEPARQEQVSPQDIEKVKYGKLYQYKDTLPPLMVSKDLQDKKYLFEEFLPELKQQNGKFIINVYIGEPPVKQGAQVKLEAVPQDLVEKVKYGLEKWNDVVQLQYANDPKKSDLNVYVESAVLPQIGVTARAIGPGNWKMQGWRNNPEDSKIVGAAILISSKDIKDFRENIHFLANNIGHELGHKLGLAHPDKELVYKVIKQDKEKISDSVEVARKILTKILKDYPEFESLSIMTAATSTNTGEQKVGELDKKAFELVRKIFNKKYSKNADTNIEHERVIKAASSEKGGVQH